MPGTEETTKQGVVEMLDGYVPPKAEDIKKDDDDEKDDKDDKGKKKDDDESADDESTDDDTDEDEDEKDEDDEEDEEDDDEEEEDDEEDAEEDDEDDEDEDEDDKKGKKKSKEHSALSDIIASIRAGKVTGKGKDEDEDDEDEDEPSKKKKTPVKKGEIYELISQEVLDDSDGVLTAKALNEFGTNIINLAIQGSLRATPVVVGKQIKRQKMFDSLVDAFYTDNEDLIKHKAFVSFTANQLASRNPGWDETKIFESLASESRKGLGIKEHARKVEDKRKKKKPAVPGKTRTKRRRKTGGKDEKRTSKQIEIDNLMD